MRRSGTGSGGGYGSRNVKHVTAPKVEPRSHRVREPAVAQIGGNYGDHGHAWRFDGLATWINLWRRWLQQSGRADQHGA